MRERQDKFEDCIAEESAKVRRQFQEQSHSAMSERRDMQTHILKIEQEITSQKDHIRQLEGKLEEVLRQLLPSQVKDEPRDLLPNSQTEDICLQTFEQLQKTFIDQLKALGNPCPKLRFSSLFNQFQLILQDGVLDYVKKHQDQGSERFNATLTVPLFRHVTSLKHIVAITEVEDPTLIKCDLYIPG
ncbi:hypothetical protein FGO68_gene9075 [Halteria grandinella]|uniref:Uncharacterized protein n=1 Tax=Halteria grandinella TaxID=5974 RepID=A0A8J8NPU3_HALGN|nr:hypothetical protein FGO68_gene9075 [Halteria grandinella]